jgi:hypothetical protein
LVDGVELFGRDRHPPRVTAISETPVHSDVKVAHARLSDDASSSQISLHGHWQVCEVRVSDRLRRRETGERAIDVTLVGRTQADRSIRQEAEDDANTRDEVTECAEFRVGFTVRRVGKNTISIPRTVNCLTIGSNPPGDRSTSLQIRCGAAMA